jgi:hypothetical protein
VSKLATYICITNLNIIKTRCLDYRLWLRVFFSSEYGAFCKIRQATDDNIIRHMHILCYVRGATNIYSEYVILLAFSTTNMCIWMHLNIQFILTLPILSLFTWGIRVSKGFFSISSPPPDQFWTPFLYEVLARNIFILQCGLGNPCYLGFVLWNIIFKL